MTDPAIAPARTGADIAAVAALFRDYAAWLGHDLSFQSFEVEVAALPGHYAPPAGELLMGRLADGTPAGCVGLRPIEPPGTCEMKRLFVSPAARGLGLGRALVTAVLDAARRAGYAEIKLDTVASLSAALALYRAAGFTPTPAYCPNPFADALYLSLRLDQPAPGRTRPPG